MADFSWKSPRACGVLMHISSLPSEQGIGSFGRGADLFLKFLRESGMKYWQICPLSPTGYGDSPYQSFSAFAGNPYFIDFEELFNCGIIAESDFSRLKALPQSRADYGKIYDTIPEILRRAAQNENAESLFETEIPLEKFLSENAFWLDDYAEFCALKKRFGGLPWSKWDKPFKFRQKYALTKDDEAEIRAVKFAQWVFFGQYAKFKAKAARSGVEIIGDIPIFLASDSADVWTRPELFELDQNLDQIRMAGVGPDYFSPTGQLWGNPLYDWRNSHPKILEFWKLRLKKAFELYDVLRLDHFRAFADYWAVPSGSADASTGKWESGPGEKFFEEIRKAFPREKFIAEDLGLLSEDAVKLADDIKIPTMAVLQFAFSSDASNPYLPHNQKRALVCYTGTHDNDTALSWYKNADPREQDFFRTYLAASGESPNWTLIQAAMICPADTAILPMQDILGLGGEARMNTPGRADGNWQWRALFGEIENARSFAPHLKRLCEISGRLCRESPADAAEK